MMNEMGAKWRGLYFYTSVALSSTASSLAIQGGALKMQQILP